MDQARLHLDPGDLEEDFDRMLDNFQRQIEEAMVEDALHIGVDQSRYCCSTCPQGTNDEEWDYDDDNEQADEFRPLSLAEYPPVDEELISLINDLEFERSVLISLIQFHRHQELLSTGSDCQSENNVPYSSDCYSKFGQDCCNGNVLPSVECSNNDFDQNGHCPASARHFNSEFWHIAYEDEQNGQFHGRESLNNGKCLPVDQKFRNTCDRTPYLTVHRSDRFDPKAAANRIRQIDLEVSKLRQLQDLEEREQFRQRMGKPSMHHNSAAAGAAGPSFSSNSLSESNSRGLHSGETSSLLRDSSPINRSMDQPQSTSMFQLIALMNGDNRSVTDRLLTLCTSRETCLQLSMLGIMPWIVQIIHDNNCSVSGTPRDIRIKAGQILHHIVACHPEDKRNRREMSVLRMLEEIRAYSDSIIHRSHENPTGVVESEDAPPLPQLVQLTRKSYEEEYRHSICLLGGLQAVAEALQCDFNRADHTAVPFHCNIRINCCKILVNLTFGDGTNKAHLCSSKSFLETLTNLVNSAHDEVRMDAAGLIRNLSWKPDISSRENMKNARMIGPLLRAAMTTKSELSLRAMLSALWNLSAHWVENKQEICAAEGALDMLCQHFTQKRPFSTTAVVELSGGILKNICSVIADREEYRAVLRRNYFYEALVDHLRAPSIEWVLNSTGILWNLSARCKQDQEKLIQLGALNLLKGLMGSKDTRIAANSAHVFRKLQEAHMQGKNSQSMPRRWKNGRDVVKEISLDESGESSGLSTFRKISSVPNSPMISTRSNMNTTGIVSGIEPSTSKTDFFTNKESERQRNPSSSASNRDRIARLMSETREEISQSFVAKTTSHSSNLEGNVRNLDSPPISPEWDIEPEPEEVTDMTRKTFAPSELKNEIHQTGYFKPTAPIASEPKQRFSPMQPTGFQPTTSHSQWRFQPTEGFQSTTTACLERNTAQQSHFPSFTTSTGSNQPDYFDPLDGNGDTIKQFNEATPMFSAATSLHDLRSGSFSKVLPTKSSTPKPISFSHSNRVLGSIPQSNIPSMMVSRSSTPAALSEIGLPITEEDEEAEKQSVYSDFSQHASQAISPSDIPSSPSQMRKYIANLEKQAEIQEKQNQNQHSDSPVQTQSPSQSSKNSKRRLPPIPPGNKRPNAKSRLMQPVRIKDKDLSEDEQNILEDCINAAMGVRRAKKSPTKDCVKVVEETGDVPDSEEKDVEQTESRVLPLIPESQDLPSPDTVHVFADEGGSSRSSLGSFPLSGLLSVKVERTDAEVPSIIQRSCDEVGIGDFPEVGQLDTLEEETGQRRTLLQPVTSPSLPLSPLLSQPANSASVDKERNESSIEEVMDARNYGTNADEESARNERDISVLPSFPPPPATLHPHLFLETENEYAAPSTLHLVNGFQSSSTAKETPNDDRMGKPLTPPPLPPPLDVSVLQSPRRSMPKKLVEKRSSPSKVSSTTPTLSQPPVAEANHLDVGKSESELSPMQNRMDLIPEMPKSAPPPVELKRQSAAFDQSEEDLLAECIYSALPKPRKPKKKLVKKEEAEPTEEDLLAECIYAALPSKGSKKKSTQKSDLPRVSSRRIKIQDSVKEITKSTVNGENGVSVADSSYTKDSEQKTRSLPRNHLRLSLIKKAMPAMPAECHFPLSSAGDERPSSETVISKPYAVSRSSLSAESKAIAGSDSTIRHIDSSASSTNLNLNSERITQHEGRSSSSSDEDRTRSIPDVHDRSGASSPDVFAGINEADSSLASRFTSEASDNEDASGTVNGGPMVNGSSGGKPRIVKPVNKLHNGGAKKPDVPVKPVRNGSTKLSNGTGNGHVAAGYKLLREEETPRMETKSSQSDRLSNDAPVEEPQPPAKLTKQGTFVKSGQSSILPVIFADTDVSKNLSLRKRYASLTRPPHAEAPVESISRSTVAYSSMRSTRSISVRPPEPLQQNNELVITIGTPKDKAKKKPAVVSKIAALLKHDKKSKTEKSAEKMNGVHKKENGHVNGIVSSAVLKNKADGHRNAYVKSPTLSEKIPPKVVMTNAQRMTSTLPKNSSVLKQAEIAAKLPDDKSKALSKGSLTVTSV